MSKEFHVKWITLFFRCIPCDLSINSSDFNKHLKRCPNYSHNDDTPDDATVDISDSPPPPPAEPVNFRQPQVLSRSRPNVQLQNTRPTTPPDLDDSIVEVAPSDTSVMEIDPPQSSPTLNRNPNPARISVNNIRPIQRPVAGPSGVRHQHHASPHHGKYSPANVKTFLYCCETCKKKFSDGQKFQNHAMLHDNQTGSAKMKCLVCSWSVNDVNISKAVTQHLFSHRHAISVARKMSQTV